MFSETFGKFACEGDIITCEVDGFKAVATIYREDTNDSPDERSECFWPSRDPKAPGYVKPEDYDVEQAKAQEIMDAWIRDEWFYCGVAVVIEREGIQLTGQYDAALWGVECNYPGSDNSYLLEVANDLLSEALEQAKAKLAKLCKGYRVTKPKAKPSRPLGLNAVGKPYSPNYDPKYRVKYRTPRAPYGPSTALGGFYEYKQAVQRKHAGNPDLIKEIFERQGLR